MRGLYAIVDLEALASVEPRLPVIAFAEALLASKPAVMQLRDKRGGARRTLDLLRALQPLAARAGTLLFANDRPDLALLARANGVHVGQDDLPVSVVRSLASNAKSELLVGLSTHSASDVAGASDEAPDYIALGPVFATASKRDHAPVLGLDGLEALAQLAREACPDAPRVAIGGISLERAKEIAEHVEMAAVIGALLPRSRGSVSAMLDETMATAQAFVRALGPAGSGGDSWR
jgi:thiamine-phosphate pyrophosphorylase